MSVVQAVATDNGAGSATIGPVTLSGTTAGNILIAFYGRGGGNAATAPTDNGSGNTWTQIGTPQSGASSYSSCWICLNPSAGTTQVTGNFASSQASTFMVVEESGVLTTGAVDQSVYAALENSGVWSSGATGTTAQANEVLYAGFASNSGYLVSPTGDSPWAYLSGTGIAGDGSVQNSTDSDVLFVVRQEVSATGAYTGSGTTIAACNHGSFIFTLEQAAAGPAPRIVTPVTSVSMR